MSLLATVYSLLFAVTLFCLHLRPDGFTGKVSYHPVIKVKTDFRSQHSAELEFALHSPVEDWTPSPHASFLEVDRKQNLRLWPVVASQLIRSPPEIQLL